MAEIFVSYTAEDKPWADWIGLELERLGHKARLFDWEVAAGGNVVKWMEEHHNAADHVLSVVSSRYLVKSKRYSEWERQGGELATISGRENFLLPVFVEPCEPPTLLAVFKRCDLHGLNEAEARARLSEYLKPAAKPSGRVPFPGARRPVGGTAPAASHSFPGSSRALSNVPITVPRFFLGRDQVMRDIRTALENDRDRVAITTLFGLRGVGKTTLAAAYASHHRSDYLATWWIRAQLDSTIRADLTGLGVRLGWVARDEKEEAALEIVMDRVREDGKGILLIFDNAIDADSIEPYLPPSGDAHILVTSNAHAWRNVATPLQIDIWSPQIGADYLISRTGRAAEQQAALALSDALGGLPLAHEQAAAYCERLEVPLATYHRRFDQAPVAVLDQQQDAPRAFHNRLTASKAFELAIDEASKLHPAAAPLIVYAALLAPEPIPLYLFSEGREEFSEPFASLIREDGLDKAIAALRTFALVDRESIPDERDAALATDCIRLHRLVRQVAAVRRDSMTQARLRLELIEAMATAYPRDIYVSSDAWLKARRLDALAVALVDEVGPANTAAHATVLAKLAVYRIDALAAYEQARPYFERALAIRECTLGPDHPDTGRSLSNLGSLLDSLGDIAGARTHYERALAIREKVLGSEHSDTARSLSNLGYLLGRQGDVAGALSHYQRALAIFENALGPEHSDTANSLNNVGYMLRAQGDLVGARSYYERALSIREKVLGPEHPDTAASLNNVGGLLQSQGDHERARLYCERALAIGEKLFGPDHPDTKLYASNAAILLDAVGLTVEAKALRQKFGIKK